MNDNTDAFVKYLSVQPFWKSKKEKQCFIYSSNNKKPVASAFEHHFSQKFVGLDSVPGIGLVGLTFSIEPDNPQMFCCGTLSKRKNIQFPNANKTFSCQFLPGEFTRIFGIPSNTFTDLEIPFGDILPVGTIAEEIATAASFEERRQLIQNFTTLWESRTKEHKSAGLGAYLLVNALENNGDVRVKEMEADTGYSSRYLQKIMLEQIGQAPKTALGNIRLQCALRMMMAHPNLPICEISQQSGFYDQAHFTKIFKEIVGITPSVFLQEWTSQFRGSGCE